MKSLLLLGLIFSFNLLANEALKLREEAKLQGLLPLPESLIDIKKEADLINLGQKLYFEKQLSINNTISCNSCHKLDQFGVDNEATSPGHDGKRGERSSPTVYNAALNFVQFWDGRAADLAAQAIGPILNPIEHGLPNEEAAMKKISSDEYISMFKKAFPNEKKPHVYKNVGVAIGAFEKTLLTPSKFDDFMNGNDKALTKAEQAGLKKFIEVGCTSCHSGAGVGGGMYMQLGLAKPYKTKDLGRFNITKLEEDKFVFKVPTLRNIAKTYPYLHDGSVKTLPEMIKVMAEFQLGVDLKKEEIKSIETFLNTLTAKQLPKF
jgi:cytochrome c peroxidase